MNQIIDFIKFSREWIASSSIKGAPNYKTAINALVRFIGKEELDIKLITQDFRLQKLIFYLKFPQNRKIRYCFLSYLEPKV